MRKIMRRSRMLGLFAILVLAVALICASVIGAGALEETEVECDHSALESEVKVCEDCGTHLVSEYAALAEAIESIKAVGGRIELIASIRLLDDITIPVGVELFVRSGVLVSGSTDKTTLVNEGVILGEGRFNATVDSQNKGKIVGNEFLGDVVNNEGALIEGGLFRGKVTNLGTLDGEAEFIASVENGGLIKGATFNGSVSNNSGAKIEGGIFTSAFSNWGTVDGGSFTEDSVVINEGTVSEGTFLGDVFNNKDLLGGRYAKRIHGVHEAMIEDGFFYVTLSDAIEDALKIAAEPEESEGEESEDEESEDEESEDDEPELPVVVLIEDKTLEEDYTVAAGVNLKFETGATIISDLYKLINHATILSGELNAALENYGTVVSGKFNKGVINNATVLGGEFLADVTNGTEATISGGTVAKGAKVINSGTIEGDKTNIKGELTNYGTVKGGIFSAKVINSVLDGLSGVIEGGSFTAEVENSATINGGSFTAEVENSATIKGGDFLGTVENTATGKITGGAFGGTLINNGEISGGQISCIATNYGSIVGGIFKNGTIGDNKTETKLVLENYGTISKIDDKHYPSFESGKLTNSTAESGEKGKIYAGSFSCEVVNLSDIFGGSFSGKVTNNGIIHSGEYTEKSIVENYSVIEGGVFGGTVNNYAGESGAALISGGMFSGTVTVAAGASISGGEFTAKSAVSNDGYITGGSFAGSVDNRGKIECDEEGELSFSGTVNNYGVILSGSFSGKVNVEKNASIEGGSFSGEVANKSGEIKGGYFIGEKSVVTNHSFITGGLFEGKVENYGSINGGKFAEGSTIENNGSITAPANAAALMLSGLVINCDNGTLMSGSYLGEVRNSGIIAGGSYGVISNDGTIKGGLFSEGFTNSGTIEGGAFYGDITNEGSITGGTFSCSVENNADIDGGEFCGIVKNYGEIIAIDANPILFTGKVENYGTIFNGRFECEVINSKVGKIHYGAFVGEETLSNLGEIAGGIFDSDIINEGSITGGRFKGHVTNVVGGVITGGGFMYAEGIEEFIVADMHLNGAHYYYYINLKEAFDDANLKTAVIYILKDVELTESATVYEGTTLDLHEGDSYKISASSSDISLVNYGIIKNANIEVAIENNGQILGGIFSAALTNKTNGFVVGGRFFESIDNSGTVSGGEFLGSVINRNGATVSGGSFSDEFTNEAGAFVTGGLYAGDFTNSGTIEGDNTEIKGELTNYGTVKGGIFSAKVINSVLDDLSGVIEGGSFTAEVENSATIKGGSFSGDVKNSGSLEGGSFAAKVENEVGGSISAGSFLDQIVNRGSIVGGSFASESSIINNGTIDAPELEFPGIVTNGESGKIKGGKFLTVITNDGDIEGGNFAAGLVNKGSIHGGSFAEGTDIQNFGAIYGGSFDATVMNEKGGKLLGGVYNTTVTNKGVISEYVVGTSATTGVYYGEVINEEGGEILHGLFAYETENVSYEVKLGDFYCVRLTDAIHMASAELGKSIYMIADQASSGGLSLPGGVSIDAEAHAGYTYFKTYRYALDNADGEIVYLRVTLVVNETVIIPEGVTIDMLGGVKLVAGEELGEVAMLLNEGVIRGGTYDGLVINKGNVIGGRFEQTVENSGAITAGKYVKILISGYGVIDLTGTQASDNMGLIISVTEDIPEGRLIYFGYDIKLPEGCTLYYGKKLDYVDGKTEPDNDLVGYGKQIGDATLVVGEHEHINPIKKSDDTHHWESCESCGAVIPDTYHEQHYTEPDCYTPATCTECGRTKGTEVHTYVPDPDHCNAFCEICGQANDEASLIEHYDEDKSLMCDACGTSMLILSDGEKLALFAAIFFFSLLIAAAIFFFFKSSKNPYGGISGILKKY